MTRQTKRRKLPIEKRIPTSADDLKHTGSLASVAVPEKSPEDMSEVAKTHMLEVFGGELPKRAFIAYHGVDAYRRDEPALILDHSDYIPSQTNKDGRQVQCYVVKYLDGDIKWFPMSIPSVELDQPAPTIGILGAFKKPRLWAEMIPDTIVRPRYCVKGRRD